MSELNQCPDPVASSNLPPKSDLRIGILLDSMDVPRWVNKIIADIQSSGFARVVFVGLNTPKELPRKSLRDKLKFYLRFGIYIYYQNWDYRRNKQQPDAFENISARTLLEGAEVVPLPPIQKGFVDRFEPADVDRVKNAQLDVVFRFGFRIIKGEILNAARYGMWSFHHDDNRQYRGAPALFWEIYEGNPVSGSILQVLTEKLDGGRVIYRSQSSTDFGSLHRNRNAVYWKTAEFALRRLKDLYLNGWEYIQSLDTYNETDPYVRGIFRKPTNWQMLRLLSKMLARSLGSRIESLFFQKRVHWFMAVRKWDSTAELGGNMQLFKPVLAPPDRFYADPFVFSSRGEDYVFFEDYRYHANKAVISCAKISESGALSEPIVVLDKPYHLSYPFLFEWQSSIYMIPESKANGTVEMYRAIDFPYKWELEKILMNNVLAVDATIFEHLGKFWLFANMALPGCSTHDELFLFHSDSPLGEWHAHPKNPIVSDVCGARPAGKIFQEKGALIRPAQDCSVCYGYAISFNRIEVISETDYRESRIGKMDHNWIPGNLGTHTYSRGAGIEMIDGKFMLKRLKPFQKFSFLQ